MSTLRSHTIKTYQVENGIKVLQCGNPIETGIVQKPLIPADSFHQVDFFFAKGRTKFSLPLADEDIVYGLGGSLGGINKRGRRYESYCTDEPHHTEDKTALYGAHNFFVIAGQKNCGYFIDFPSRITYDVGFGVREEMSIEIYGQDFYLYIIEGDAPGDVVTKFLRIIGKAYVPPKWAFGYFQSRWGYRNKNDVLKVSERFRRHGIPLEGIFLDLDYMDDFKVFTISQARFGDFGEFVAKLKREGVYLVPIIDAGVKVEAGYHVYQEGVAGGHFCKDSEGKPYAAAVWPGKVHFPDFFREETRQWFGSKYKVLTDFGIEGFWNDMNEPAIFYDQKSIAEAICAAVAARGENLDSFSFFALKDKFCNIANKEEYYQRFFHQVDRGLVPNSQVHNLYGYYMTKSAQQGLSRLLPGKRFLLISRASSIGAHRYGGVWTGDNCSWWSHLDQNIKQMPALNMCGFYYAGADTGGFGADCSGELLLRWLQFSIFTPLLRNHSAVGCRTQEPYAFGPDVLEKAKELIKARYSLIPYLYSEFMKSLKSCRLMFKPLAFEYSGELAKQVEDQLLIGKELMVAPVYKPNNSGRYVYLPEKVAEVCFNCRQPELTVRDQGIHYLRYGLGQLKFYLRQNAVLPYVEPCMNTSSLNMETVKVLAFVDDRAEYVLYDDDGISLDYQYGKHFQTVIRIEAEGNDYRVEVNNNNPAVRHIKLLIVNSRGNVKTKAISCRC